MIPLVLRGCRRYWLALSAIGLLAALVTGTAGTADLIGTAMSEAERQSAGLRVPDGVVLVQPATDQARDRLAIDDALGPIADTVTNVVVGSVEPRVATATVRLTPRPFEPLGVVVEGRAAQRAGELTASRALADTLGVELGDTVSIGSRDLDVVGLMVDPAAAGDLTASAVVDRLRQDEVTSWTGTESDLSRYGDSVSTMTADMAALLVRDNLAQKPGPGARIAPMILGIGAVMLALLLALARRAFKGDAHALRAAGMADRELRRFLAGVAATILLVGAAAGQAAATLLVVLGRERISALWGQAWLTVPADPTFVVASLLAVITVPVLLLVGGAPDSCVGCNQGGGPDIPGCRHPPHRWGCGVLRLCL